MEAEAFKYIGGGLMALGTLGGAIGVGHIFNGLMIGLARNPSAGKELFKNAIIGAAMAEGLGIAALGVGAALLFG